MEVVVLAVQVRHAVVHVIPLVTVLHRLPVVLDAPRHVRRIAAVAVLAPVAVDAHQVVVEVVAVVVQVVALVLVVVVAAAIVLLHVLVAANEAVPLHVPENVGVHHVAECVLMFVTEASVMAVAKVLVNLPAKAHVFIRAI